MPKRILIVKPSSFGDIVMTLPALALLRARHPKAEIGWFVNHEFAGLVEGHPMLDHVHVWDRGRRGTLRGYFRGAASMRRTLRDVRALGYDVAYDFQGLFRSAWFMKRSGTPVRIGFADGRECSPFFYTEQRTIPPEAVHAVDRYRALVDPSDTSPVEFPLVVNEAAQAAAKRLLGELGLAANERFVTICAGARWSSKRWPAERFSQVAAWLHEKYQLRGVCIGTKEFQSISARIASGTGADATGRTSIPELAALLGRAEFLLTNDSGPMHLAAAIGTPVVALFGPTDPARIGPYGPGHEIVRVPVECAPCAKRDCPEKLPCMAQLNAETVLEACERLLQQRRAENGTWRDGSGS